MSRQPRGSDRGAVVLVAAPRRWSVGRPAVGDDATSRLDVGVEERREALCARVGDEADPCAAESMVVDLHRGGEQDLPECSPSRHPGLWPAEVALVDLDVPVQTVTASSHHHRAVAVQHRPGGLDRPEFHLALELGRRDAGLAVDHEPRCGKPDAERRPGLVEDRPRRGGHLAITAAALPATISEPPSHRARIVRADEPLRPAEPVQVVETLRVLREPSTQLRVGTGVVTSGYRLPLGCLQPSRVPKWKALLWKSKWHSRSTGLYGPGTGAFRQWPQTPSEACSVRFRRHSHRATSER